MMAHDLPMLRDSVDWIMANDPDHPQTIEWASFAAMASGAYEVERLLPVLERAVEKFPDRYRSASNLSDCYTMLGRPIDAARTNTVALERLVDHIRRSPEDGHARSLLGVVMVREGKVEDGLAQNRRAEASTPDDARVWYNHVCALSLAQKTDEALAKFAARALELRSSRFDWPTHGDPDLANLRKHPGFQALLESMRASG